MLLGQLLTEHFSWKWSFFICMSCDRLYIFFNFWKSFRLFPEEFHQTNMKGNRSRCFRRNSFDIAARIRDGISKRTPSGISRAIPIDISADISLVIQREIHRLSFLLESLQRASSETLGFILSSFNIIPMIPPKIPSGIPLRAQLRIFLGCILIFRLEFVFKFLQEFFMGFRHTNLNQFLL